MCRSVIGVWESIHAGVGDYQRRCSQSVIDNMEWEERKRVVAADDAATAANGVDQEASHRGRLGCRSRSRYCRSVFVDSSALGVCSVHVPNRPSLTRQRYKASGPARGGQRIKRRPELLRLVI